VNPRQLLREPRIVFFFFYAGSAAEIDGTKPSSKEVDSSAPASSVAELSAPLPPARDANPAVNGAVNGDAGFTRDVNGAVNGAMDEAVNKAVNGAVNPAVNGDVNEAVNGAVNKALSLWRRNGVIVFENLLSPEETASLLSAVRAAEANENATDYSQVNPI